MWPGRIAVAIVIVWGGSCLALAAVLFVNLPNIESPERYPALLIGLVMLYMGGSMLAGLIWPPKPKDPNAPIEIPPLAQVRGRTSYGDGSVKWLLVVLTIGAMFLFGSLGAAAEQPVVLVVSLIAVGVLAGAGVMAWRMIQYGRARLELEGPARRGDTMRGVITTSGFGWTVADRDFDATVDLVALRTYRTRRSSSSVTVARASAVVSSVRNGNDMTFRFTATIPVIDTSEGRFSWNVQLATQSPDYQATFLIDVA
ncbi:MAG TPA: hypothetical protein VEU30_11805 [Thermoanaerobaculia bacterium]|nr:hypothetical protein [Thermoanaerobaculia bacterium]